MLIVKNTVLSKMFCKTHAFLLSLFAPLLTVATIVTPFYLSASELEKTVDKTLGKDMQLSAWKLSEGNFQLELIQRSPEQTRSFFQGRGFSAKVAEDMATSCVFQTIGRNTEAENKTDSVTVDLSEWRLVAVDNQDKMEKSIKLKEDWNKEWKDANVSTASRIAFRWATYPSEQSFDPGGDFNWGMISMGPKPDTIFDLHVFWKQGDKKHDAWIKKMQCPKDNSDQ